MEIKNKMPNLVGFRKFMVTLLAFTCVMAAGYTMETDALSPVVWGIVSVSGIFITGSIIKGSIKRNNYEGENQGGYQD